jgi:hypothetical protein
MALLPLLNLRHLFYNSFYRNFCFTQPISLIDSSLMELCLQLHRVLAPAPLAPKNLMIGFCILWLTAAHHVVLIILGSCSHCCLDFSQVHTQQPVCWTVNYF